MTTRLDTDTDTGAVAEVGPRPGARPLRKDAVRNRALLVTAAREVFARRGLEAGLDDIARHAGVGVGTAYRHFANKYDLAAAVMAESIDTVVRHAEQALAADDPWDGLVGFVEAVLLLQTRDRGLREVMMGAQDPHSKVEVHNRLLGPIGALVRRCQDAGAVRTEAAVSDVGFVVLMLCQVADVAGSVDESLWRRYLPTLMAGLRPNGPPLDGAALSDDEFRAATIAYQACHARGAR